MPESSPPADLRASLTPLDIKVLEVLVESSGRVVGRDFIARQTGIESGTARRVDASLVALRRVLGHDSLLTVRSRGWMLTPEGEASARTVLQ
jgi:DNA-binding response OmpR family regulator